MTLLKIALMGEPILRKRAREVSEDELRSEEIQTFIDDLIETMHDAKGAGLAAPQVYRSLRICAVHVIAPNPRYPYKPAIDLRVMVNPVIDFLGDETFENFEGCLSVNDVRGRVDRHAHIRLRYLDRHGVAHDEEVKGISAGTYQHECDHLDGKLFIDSVRDKSSLTTWKNFDTHHKEKFIKEAEAIVKRFGS